MWPLLRQGDRLWVERCDERACAVGGVAVRPIGQAFFAHVVTSLAPLATASLWGVPDVSDAPVLGRVVAYARGAEDFVTALDRGPPAAALRWAPRVGPVLKRVPLLRSVVRATRALTRR